jgi:signal transduction histidine kinase
MGNRAAVVTAGIRRTDVVLTVVFLAVSVVQVLVLQPLTDSLAVDLLLTTCMVLPLIWRRTHPVAAATAWSAAIWVPVDAFLFVGYVVAILLFYSVGRWAGSLLSGGLVCALAIATGTVGTLLGPADPTAGLLSWWLVVLAPCGFGLLMRLQEQETGRRLHAEREAARQRAIEEERARIVRELHDVVGHEVTLLSIQSEAAAQALARSPELAGEPMAAVRETAHRANRELRAILHLLGEGEHPATPDGRGLAELVDRADRQGIPAALTVSGQPWRDAPEHWLAVNRIVQESLTNAGRHAPGEKVKVHVDWAADAVRLEVVNATAGAPAPGDGMGLPGMAERARLLGGTFTASAHDGRYTVAACLPAPSEGWT